MKDRSDRWEIDLDFARYVQQRRGMQAEQARTGAAYAYAGEAKFRKGMAYARPVTLAIEATVRLWKSVERTRLLGSAVKVTDVQFPRIYGIAARCADTLHIPMPAVYVSPAIGELNARALGTDDDAQIVVNGALVDHLNDDELAFVVGHECGHIQNNHVVYNTALHFLTAGAAFYVRWIVQPAILALKAWSRRAEVTCDRAGLLCVRDLDVATAAIVKLALGSQKLYQDLDIKEYLKQHEEGRSGLSRFAEITSTHPYLPKRIKALQVFAESSFYRQFAGLGKDGLDASATDEKVGEIMSVM